MPLMSEIGETSSSAAARGSTFLPDLVAAMRICEYSLAMLATRLETFSARWFA